MTDTLPLADTSDMLAVHRVFRNALSSASELVGATATDPSRVEVIAGYYGHVLWLLHAHHESEDVLLTPRLLERCTPEELADVERVAGQHDAVLPALQRSDVALALWRNEPTAESAAELIDALTELREGLVEHLDDEERLVLPIAGRYVNVVEWGEMPGHAMRAYSGDKMWLVIGLVQEQMTPAQIADMVAHMPPPVVEMWTTAGRTRFADYIGRVRS